MRSVYFKKRIREPKVMARIELSAFDTLAKTNYKRWFIPFVDDVLIRAGIRKGVVADIGSGPGLLVSEMAKRSRNFRVVGIDRSPYSIELGRKNCKSLHNVTFIRGRAEKLPLKTNTVDIVLSKDSLHELGNPRRVIREMLRIVKPGGIVYIQDLRRDIPFKILSQAIPPKTTIQKLQFYSTRAAYTKPEIRSLMKKLSVRSYTLITRQVTPLVWRRYKSLVSRRTELENALHTRFILVIRKTKS